MAENIVTKYGPFWARNEKNFAKLRTEAEGLKGMYILYCGWFPVYVGLGKLIRRLSKHKNSKSKAWDRFTWIAIEDYSHARELEAIFLRSLPFYLRLNNKQAAHLPEVHSTHEQDLTPIVIKLPKMTPKGRAHKNKK